MRNRKPIFIAGFARGGSNIVLNFFLSHPDVCLPRGETQEVFRGAAGEGFATRWAKRLRYFPVAMMEREDVLDNRNWRPRRPFSRLTMVQIDRIYHAEKLRATGPGQNMYKAENVRYTQQEIRTSRLLAKILNGLIFVSPQYARMYPDATFIGLVRHGLAVCEGHIRRGYEAGDIAKKYAAACSAMIADERRLPRYRIFRYEDIVADPVSALHRMYEFADLDPERVPKIRMETKRVMGADGSREFIGGASSKEMMWCTKNDVRRFVREDANSNQIRRLTAEQRSVIIEQCGESLEHFGYR
ncbi:MAG: sulfotransferase [Acidobacteriota bacterium]